MTTHPTNTIQRDSGSWIFFVKLSLAALGAGIVLLPVDLWVRGYLGMGALFAVGSTITLAKTLRDDHEAQRLINRLSEARAEKMLKEVE